MTLETHKTCWHLRAVRTKTIFSMWSQWSVYCYVLCLLLWNTTIIPAWLLTF